MKILFSGGGTGGHVVPLLALSREIRRVAETSPLEFEYLGPPDSFSRLLLTQEGIRVDNILAGKMRRYWGVKATLQNILDVFVLTPLGVVQAFFHIFLSSPDLLFSKGGYGALPVTIAAWILQVPIFLHESDAKPGLANALASKFADRVFTSFPNTQGFSKKKTTLVGNPTRKSVTEGDKEEASRLFHLKGGKPVVMFVGGSQGSERLNDVLLAVLNEALAEFEILHQTGERNLEQVRAEGRAVASKNLLAYWHPVPFYNEVELRHAYAAADIIVSRAGASFIFEIAALGKPSILIPLPEAAQNHQIANAYAYEKAGASVVLEEANLTPHFFLEKLRYFASHPRDMEKMRSAARSFAKPKAARLLAQLVVEYLSAS